MVTINLFSSQCIVAISSVHYQGGEREGKITAPPQIFWKHIFFSTWIYHTQKYPNNCSEFYTKILIKLFGNEIMASAEVMPKQWPLTL